MLKFVERIEEFFLRPASARPLGVLRILLALVLIYQAYTLRHSALDFLSRDGLVKEALVNHLRQSQLPGVATFVKIFKPLGVGETGTIYTLCGAYFISLLLLLAGFKSRCAAAASWFFHWVLINTAYSTTYGVDLFAHVFLFYMIWMPIGDTLALDARLSGYRDRATPQARLALRVLQLHLCIMYFASGIEKAGGVQWWNGELIWRAVTLPEYAQFDFTWLANWPLIAKVSGWSTLFFEIGYVVFIWPALTRRFWVASIVALHLGIAVFLGLTSFGLIMAVLTFSIFGISAEPEGRNFQPGWSHP